MTEPDADVHARLVRALNAGEVGLRFRFHALITPSSPAFRPREVAFLVVVLAGLALVPQYVGAAGYSNVVLAGYAMVALVWGRWLWQRIKHRAVELGLESEENWQALWRRGAFELKTGGRTSSESCVSPTGDWQGFVRRHLAHENETNGATTE